MIETLILYVLRLLGGVTKEQWKHTLDSVVLVDSSFATSAEKRAEVEQRLRSAGYALRKHVLNLLIETAVAWLKHKSHI